MAPVQQALDQPLVAQHFDAPVAGCNQTYVLLVATTTRVQIHDLRVRLLRVTNGAAHFLYELVPLPDKSFHIVLSWFGEMHPVAAQRVTLEAVAVGASFI